MLALPVTARRDRTVWSAFAGAGIATGLAGLASWAWPLAWLGFGLFAFALATARTRRQAVAGATVAVVVTKLIWFHWAFAMIDALIGADMIGLGLGFILVETLPGWALIVACALALHGRGLVWLWLPLAWALGERVQVWWTSVANDWLFTQVEVTPIMNLLGHVGMWPTVLVCLGAAACVGESFARRDRRWLWPAAAVVVVLLVLPAPRRASSERLAGIGAVHAATLDTMPSIEGVRGLELVVWPEAAFAARPHVSEGAVEGVALDAPLGPLDGPMHLVGFLTALHAGKQNAALSVTPRGEIVDVRAKRVLFPITERAFMGLGEDRFERGKRKPLLTIGDRRVVPLVCGELLTRELVADGKAAGGEVLAVLASDSYHAGLDVVHRQVLAHLRLRAIEYDLPAVYASRNGRAAFVAADGQVLGTSAADAPSGVLVFDGVTTRDEVVDVAPTVAVIYSEAAPHLRPDCPPGRCTYQTIESSTCGAARADTVIVAGHGAPPEYLGTTPDVVADAVACLGPELVVVDTCFGASTPLFAALAERGAPLVVGAPALVAGRGFRYRAALFEPGSADDRARAVVSPGLTIMRPDAATIRQAEAAVAAATGDELRPRVRHWSPTLVEVVLPGGEVLVAPADWKTIGRPPSRRERASASTL